MIASRTGRAAAEAARDQHEQHVAAMMKPAQPMIDHVQDDAGADDDERHPVRRVVAFLVERARCASRRDACQASTAPHSVSPRRDVGEKPRPDLRVALRLRDALRLVDDEDAEREQPERDQELAE